MSTKTNFKRIALVAVAALGLGVLSSVPSQAGVSSLTTSLTTAATTTTTVVDSSTAAVITLSAAVSQISDSVSVSLIKRPGTTQNAYLGLIDTTTTLSLVDTVPSITVITRAAMLTRTQTIVSKFLQGTGETIDAGDTTGDRSAFHVFADSVTANTGYIGANFRLQLETAAAGVTAGTYDYSIVTKVYTAGVYDATKDVFTNVSITVPALASNAKTVNGALSSVTMGNTTANLVGTTSTSSDSTIAVASTASATDVAVVRVRLRNASAGNAQESITASITAG